MLTLKECRRLIDAKGKRYNDEELQCMLAFLTELTRAVTEQLKIEDNEKKTVILQRRSLRVMHSLPEGHILTREDLFPLRPNTEMAYKPNQIGLIIGKKLRIKKNIGESIDFGDLIE